MADEGYVVMETVTIVLLASREDYLNPIFSSLEFLECNPLKTNLFCIVDGPANLFTDVRNRVANTKFNEKLCVHFQSDVPQPRPNNYLGRRKRISSIHNQLKQYLQECDYLLLLEDDQPVPTDALQKLLRVYSYSPFAGLVSGVTTGRWGFRISGLWRVNDPYEITEITSVIPKEDIEPIDAAGMFCTLIKREHYMQTEFKEFEGVLGPDAYLGFSLRQLGYQNYADTSVRLTHKTSQGDLIYNPESLQTLQFKKVNDHWRQSLLR